MNDTKKKIKEDKTSRKSSLSTSSEVKKAEKLVTGGTDINNPKENVPNMVHYLFGIGIEPSTSKSPGAPFLDFFWSFTLQDYREVVAQQVMFNCMEGEQKKDELDITKLKEFQNAYICMQYRSRVQGLTVANFKSERELSREKFEKFILEFIKEKGMNNFKEIAKESINGAEI